MPLAVRSYPFCLGVKGKLSWGVCRIFATWFAINSEQWVDFIVYWCYFGCEPDFWTSTHRRASCLRLLNLIRLRHGEILLWLEPGQTKVLVLHHNSYCLCSNIVSVTQSLFVNASLSRGQFLRGPAWVMLLPCVRYHTNQRWHHTVCLREEFREGKAGVLYLSLSKIQINFFFGFVCQYTLRKVFCLS